MHAVKQYLASPGGANSKVVGPLGSAAADAESAKSHPAGLIFAAESNAEYVFLRRNQEAPRGS